MYEHRTHKLASRKKFLLRILTHGIATLIIIIISLLAGVLGYHLIAKLDWVDSFMNASMILGGMGPVDTLNDDASKIFAGCYALYSGLVLLIAVSILAAPILHRIMHKLHLSTKD